MHSLFLRGHEGGVVIQNIPKRINYIMKYLNCHLDCDGKRSLITNK